MLSLSQKAKKGIMLRGLLTADRCDEIKQEVIAMFEECQIATYPIDCFAIANKLYYVLRAYSSLNTEKLAEAYSISSDGYSLVEQNPFTGLNQYVIYYNDITLNERMRWTIFHEIGHIYLGHHDRHDAAEYQTEEAEANFFAKYAIAPPPLVNITNCKNPFDIAKTFCTSFEASCHLFSYYQKWLQYGSKFYEPFELKMLALFHAS